MKLKASLVLALTLLAALSPAAVRAEHRDVPAMLPAMLSTARACLTQVSALRETEPDWTLDRGPRIRDLSFLVTGRSRGYSANRMRFEGEMAAWDSPYSP